MIKAANSGSQGDLEKLQESPSVMASWQHAQKYLVNGRHAPALASYRNLVQKFPGVSQLWAELGIAAAGELDFTLATQASERAAELASNDSSLLVSLGQQYHRLRRLENACACFERAVAVDPSSVQARLSLAAWFERVRRLDDAWECIQACLALHPKDCRALYYQAFLMHRRGLNEKAETALRDLLKVNLSVSLDVQSDAHHLLGVVLDALGQYAEALSCLDKAKTLRRQKVNATAFEQAYDKTDRERRGLLAELTPEMVRHWREEGTAACPHAMALLCGPPRSGTTLIEQILGAHPDILAFDETEAYVQELLNNIQPAPPARGLTCKSLNSLTPSMREQLTRRYFKSILRETRENPVNKVFLDKNPSIVASLHVWLRLFPQSKVVVALRDPRDMIISYYFQNLTLSGQGVNFLTLEQAVRFYTDCMDAWLRMRELGGFDWIEIRYEDVVGNLAGEGRRVTNFLGLTWHEAQTTYYETANRKFIQSPTYNEVTQPVYNKAVGRWQHYAGAMAPFQAKLEPYLRAFGYC